MKQHALGLAIATVAFAGSSLYLWTQLRQERARVAQVEETGRQLNARIAELEKARGQFALNVTPGGGFGAGPPANPSGPQKATQSPDEMTPEAREAWKAVARSEPPAAMLKMMRAGNRAQVTPAVRENSPGKWASARRQRASSSICSLINRWQGSARHVTSPTRRTCGNYFEELQRANEAATVELIGPDKAAQLKAYQEAMPTRMEFEMLAQHLDGGDAPLSAEQRDKLLDAVRRGTQARFPAGNFRRLVWPRLRKCIQCLER